jgi:hypothetical protein
MKNSKEYRLKHRIGAGLISLLSFFPALSLTIIGENQQETLYKACYYASSLPLYIFSGFCLSYVFKRNQQQ